MCFVTVDDVKEAVGIPPADTTHDAKLTKIVAAVNGTMLGWFFLDDCAPTQYTNRYDVLDYGTPGIWLVQYPVISIDAVSCDGTALDLSQIYLARPRKMGLMQRARNHCVVPWPVGAQRTEVTHTAGWAPGDPALAALCGAALAWAVERFNVQPKSGLRSERIGQYSYTLGSATGGGGSSSSGGTGGGSIPEYVAAVANQYVRPFVPGD